MRALNRITLLALIAAALLTWQWTVRREAPGTEACLGLPRAVSPADLRHAAVVLRNTGFTLGYSEFYANPLWVSYDLETPRYPVPRSRPEDGFRRDPRSLRGIEPDAFAHTGFQRGHLAPNYAMYRVHGPRAQQDSFLMTNISPQRPRLNQKLWQRLEEVIMDHLLAANGPLCVITGPVFGRSPRILPSGVAVPDAFYKILVAGRETPRVLAFVVPQDVAGDEPLDSLVTTVDEVERMTGLDFLELLPDSDEQRLEQARGSGWGLEAVAALPARY